MTVTLSADQALLASPISFHHAGISAPNRFLKSAMTERLCEWSEEESEVLNRGKPTAAYLELYRVWGQGAIGKLRLL